MPPIDTQHDEDSSIVPNKEELYAVVKRLSGVDSFGRLRWKARKLHGGGRCGVYRLWGTAESHKTSNDWSVILKVLSDFKGSATELLDPRRELEIYRSDIREYLYGLRLPKLYSYVEEPGNEIRLWLEDLEDTSSWSIQQYGRAALQLGRFSASGRELRLDRYPWLSREFVRKLHQCAVRIEGLQEHPFHPQLLEHLSSDDLKIISFLERQIDRFIDTLEALPQTFCHMDSTRRNLLGRKDASKNETLIGIDWEFSGAGAIGQDLVPFVILSTFLSHSDVGSLNRLDQLAFSSYLTGLRDGGCSVDRQLVRAAYGCASTVLLLTGIHFLNCFAHHEHAQQAWAEAVGQNFDQILIRFHQMLPYLLQLGSEAERLVSDLKLHK